MKKIIVFIVCTLLVLSVIAGQAASASEEAALIAPKPILIQGAMTAEVNKLAEYLENPSMKAYGPFIFWVGMIDRYPVVVSKTLMGISNSAAATAVAIEKFSPIAIINQGTAGGHDPSLHLNDIVIGVRTFNGNIMMTNEKKLGEGSHPLEWKAMDWLGKKANGEEDVVLQVRMYESDARLVAAAKVTAPSYKKGKVVEGVSVSGDIWNNELDRIRWFHDRFGSTVEEAEAASVAQISSLYHIPYLSVRVVSNNITNGARFDISTASECQRYVYDVVREYIQTLK